MCLSWVQPWDGQQCAARGGEIWLQLTGMICPCTGNLTTNFWKMSNPHPMPCLPPSPPPTPPAGLTLIGALGPVHTNAFSERIDRFTSTLPFWCVYDCPHRETFEDDRMARCDVSRRKLDSLRMLQTDVFAIFEAIFPFIVFILMRFQPSSTVHIDMMYNRFRFDPLSRAFSNRWVFDKNAQRISVDGRRKRAEMYAFSNENKLVWKEP